MANLEFMPGDQGVLVNAERKRKMAETLRKQATTPQGQMVGGIYVAPSITQYLSSGLKEYQAGKLDREGNEQEEGIYRQRQQKVSDANQRLIDALRPKQVQDGFEQSLPERKMDQFGSPVQGQDMNPIQGAPKFKTVNPTIEDLMIAQTQYGSDIGDPNALNSAVSNRINYGQQQQTREDNQAFRSQEAQLAREQRAQELQFRIQDARTSAQEKMQFQRELAQMNNDARRDMVQMTAANRQPQAPVSVMGPDGKPLFVPPGQAYGMRPYGAAQEAKDAAKVQSQSSAELSAQQAIDQAALLMGHKGRQMGTGTSSWVGSVPVLSTDAKDFQKNLDTFKAQTFVPMVSAMKGMGALSDAEGRKLTDSVGALDPNMSEKAFEDSLRAVTKTLYDKAKASGLNVSMPDFGSAPKTNSTTGKVRTVDW
jgi:hypothetical protein